MRKTDKKGIDEEKRDRKERNWERQDRKGER